MLLFGRLRIDERSQNVVAPGAVDEQVVAGIALRDEAEAPQEAAAAFIGRLIVCHGLIKPSAAPAVGSKADSGPKVATGLAAIAVAMARRR